MPECMEYMCFIRTYVRMYVRMSRAMLIVGHFLVNHNASYVLHVDSIPLLCHT